MEHAVPEQLFTNAQNPGEAISAVKAIQKASAAGQRIYHITPANQSAILGNIHHDADTMTDIRNALNAGKEVITHTDQVSVPGWSGAGYIITDADTGAGAFKIAGGGNGGTIFIAGVGIFAIGALMALGVATPGGLFASMLLASFFISLGVHIVLIEILTNPDLSWDSVKSNILAIASLILVPFGFLEPLIAVTAAILSILLTLYGIV